MLQAGGSRTAFPGASHLGPPGETGPDRHPFVPKRVLVPGPTLGVNFGSKFFWHRTPEWRKTPFRRGATTMGGLGSGMPPTHPTLITKHTRIFARNTQFSALRHDPPLPPPPPAALRPNGCLGPTPAHSTAPSGGHRWGPGQEAPTLASVLGNEVLAPQMQRTWGSCGLEVGNTNGEMKKNLNVCNWKTFVLNRWSFLDVHENMDKQCQ